MDVGSWVTIGTGIFCCIAGFAFLVFGLREFGRDGLYGPSGCGTAFITVLLMTIALIVVGAFCIAIPFIAQSERSSTSATIIITDRKESAQITESTMIVDTVKFIQQNQDHMTFYLDGVQVDPATIDINLYDFSVSDDCSTVFLTHKIYIEK